MTVSVVLAILGSILALAGALGVAYAVFKSATVSKTIELLKVENEVQGKALARQAEELLQTRERLKSLETANSVLQGTVSGEKAVKDLRDQLATWIGQLTDSHRAMLALLQDIHDTIRARGREAL